MKQLFSISYIPIGVYSLCAFYARFVVLLASSF